MKTTQGFENIAAPRPMALRPHIRAVRQALDTLWTMAPDDEAARPTIKSLLEHAPAVESVNPLLVGRGLNAALLHAECMGDPELTRQIAARDKEFLNRLQRSKPPQHS